MSVVVPVSSRALASRYGASVGLLEKPCFLSAAIIYLYMRGDLLRPHWSDSLLGRSEKDKVLQIIAFNNKCVALSI